jgi:predicted enzyme related to lactoylglutathione lyase
METTKNAKVEAVDTKLEVVVLGVSDLDRAKAFYQNLGWRCSRKSLPTSQNYLM